MTQSRISLLENDRADPSLLEVEILALGLDVTPGWLAFREGGEAVSAGLHFESPETHELPAREAVAGKGTKKQRGTR